VKAGWTDTVLGDVATIDRRVLEPDEIKAGTLYVGLENLVIGGGLRDVAPVAEGQLASAKFTFDPVHVLFGKLRPNLAKSARPGFTGVCSTDILPIRPGPNLDRGYLAHFVASPGTVALATQRAAGVNLPRLSPTQLESFRLSLPPLNEQRRIARVLDAADRLKATRRAALTRFDALGSAHFIASFGEPDENPYGWDVRPVSELVSSFDGGKSFAGEDDYDSHAPYRVLRVSAVTSGEFMPEESRPVPRGYSPPSGHHVRPGDLLISRANTSALVGAVALVDRATDGLLLPDKIWRFSWRDDEAAVPEFVWQLFRTRAIRSAITRRSTGTSGSMKNISAEKLMGIEVIQPPVDHQREFARVFRHTRRLRAKATRQQSHLDALFASLQHRAFTGTL
jgi:type I restriction enzyme S subunit